MAKQVRRLNKRFVTFLTIGIMVVLTVAIGVLIMATRHKDPQMYADRGDKCMVGGDYLKAVQNYMKAYKYSGKDPSWLIKASEAQYEHGDVQYALKALQTALTADPNLVDARQRLVDMYWNLWGRSATPALAKQMGDEADKLVTMIPEASAEKDPALKQALALGYHVRGVARNKRRAEDSNLERLAREDLQKAIALDPKPDYVQSLAMMSLEDAQQMARLAASGTSSPEAFDTYITKMDVSIGEAEKLYLSLAKSAKDNSEAFVKLGDFYFQIWGRLEQGISELCKLQGSRVQNAIYELNQKIKELNASKTVAVGERRRSVKRLRSEIAREQRNVTEWNARQAKFAAKAKQCNERALEFYKQALALAKDTESKVASRLALAGYYIGSGKMSDAEPLIREAIQEDPKGYKAYRLFALIKKQEASQAKEDDRDALIDEAITMVNHRVNELDHDFGGVRGRMNRYQRADLIAILTEFYLDRQQGDDLAKADNLLKELEVDASENPILFQLKATRAIADKDYKTAIMLLEKADKLNNGQNPSVKFILAELYSRTGNLGAAKVAVNEGMALRPGTYSGLRLAMSIYLQLDDAESALRFANQILQLPDRMNDKNALGIKLECLVRLGQMNEADAVAKELQVAGTDLNWPVQKARLLIRQGKDTEAEELLEKALAKDSDNKQAAGYLVEVYSRQNKLEKARSVLKSALAKYPDDEGLLRLKELMAISDPQERQARMQEISQQMTEEALDDQLAKAEEETDPFKKAVLLFDQYSKRNEMDQARKYLDEAVKLDAEKANILNFRYALIQKDWTRAQKCVDLAKTKNLDSVDGLMYEAELTNARGWDRLNAEKADEAKGYFEQSAKAAEEVVRRLPNDSQARAMLGEAYWWLDRRNEAGTQIAKAIDLNPNNPYALRASCVELWDAISGGGAASSAMVQTFAGNLRKAYRQMPWNSWLKDKMEWFKTSLAKQREFKEDETGDAAKVVARREQVRKENPDDVENLLRLAFVYENRNEVVDLDKAEACYQQALGTQPSGNLVQQYVAFARRHHRMANVEAFLKELADKDATAGKGEGYTVLGYYYMMNRDLTQAESAFAQAVKVEDTAAKRLDMAVFYRQAGKMDQSIEWCRKTLETKTDARQDRMIRSMLINSLLSKQQWVQAADYIDQYKKRYAQDPQGELFSARLVLDQGKMSEAEGILTKILTKSPDYVEALDIRSKVYMYTWQLNKAEADLEKIKTLNPRGFGLQGQIRLAKLYCEMGKTVDAEREARSLIEGARGQAGDSVEFIRRDLLPSLSSALKPRAYEDLLVWAANLYRGYWGWVFERGHYAMLRLDYRQACEAYSKAWDAVAEAPVRLKTMVLSSYLEALYKAKAYDKVLTLAEKVLKTDEFSGTSSLISGWVSAAYYAKGDSAKGFSTLQSVLSNETNPLVIWQVTRNMILKADKGSALIGPLEEAAGSSAKNPQNVRLALACAYFAADQDEKGAAIYRSLSDSGKDAREKALYLYLLGQEYTEAKHYVEAAKAFEVAKDHQENNLVVMNNLSYILEEYLGKAGEAEKIIKPAYEKAPNNSDLLDTYGQVLIKLNQQEAGLYYTAKSVWVHESATSRYHLGMILLSQDRRADADIQFRRALQLVGEDKELEQKIRDGLSRL